MLELANKVAVVTGAGRGIGSAIARGYAKAGAKVCCAARTEAEVAATAASIRESGGEAIHAVCDVTDLSSVEHMFSSVSERFGGVDIVLANAGLLAEFAPVESGDPAHWRAIVDTNLVGFYHTARAAIPYLKQRGAGKIIVTGSGGGHRGMPHISAYSCAKAGAWMLVKVLAQELAAFNIAVNELVPGVVDTDMFRAGLDTDTYTQLSKVEWIKQPEDVVPLALFLATQPALGPSAQSFSLTRREIF